MLHLTNCTNGSRIFLILFLATFEQYFRLAAFDQLMGPYFPHDPDTGVLQIKETREIRETVRFYSLRNLVLLMIGTHLFAALTTPVLQRCVWPRLMFTLHSVRTLAMMIVFFYANTPSNRLAMGVLAYFFSAREYLVREIFSAHLPIARVLDLVCLLLGDGGAFLCHNMELTEHAEQMTEESLNGGGSGGRHKRGLAHGFGMTVSFLNRVNSSESVKVSHALLMILAVGSAVFIMCQDLYDVYFNRAAARRAAARRAAATATSTAAVVPDDESAVSLGGTGCDECDEYSLRHVEKEPMYTGPFCAPKLREINTDSVFVKEALDVGDEVRRTLNPFLTPLAFSVFLSSMSIMYATAVVYYSYVILPLDVPEAVEKLYVPSTFTVLSGPNAVFHGTALVVHVLVLFLPVLESRLAYGWFMFIACSLSIGGSVFAMKILAAIDRPEWSPLIVFALAGAHEFGRGLFVFPYNFRQPFAKAYMHVLCGVTLAALLVPFLVWPTLMGFGIVPVSVLAGSSLVLVGSIFCTF